MTKKYVLLVSGPQGSGKSTQAERVGERYKMPLFEAGVELREFVQTPGPGVQEVKKYMIEGQLVPHHYVNDLFHQFVTRYSNARGVISDGFPRSLEQWHVIEETCEKLGAELIGLNISIDEATSLARIQSRVEVGEDGQPKRRPDDSPAAVRERLDIYHDQTLPVLEVLKQHHQLFVIDGSSDMDSVSQAVFAALDPILRPNES